MKKNWNKSLSASKKLNPASKQTSTKRQLKQSPLLVNALLSITKEADNLTCDFCLLLCTRYIKFCVFISFTISKWVVLEENCPFTGRLYLTVSLILLEVQKCNHDLTLYLVTSTEYLEGRVNKLSDTQVATP